jgi:hypothetical protein
MSEAKIWQAFFSAEIVDSMWFLVFIVVDISFLSEGCVPNKTVQRLCQKLDLEFLKAEGRGGYRSEGFIFANCKRNSILRI